MQLNIFIQSYIDLGLRQGRSFGSSDTAGRGWISIMNQILRRLEAEGLISLGQKKEVGVIVDNEFWIDIPSDLRAESSISLKYPDFSEVKPLKDVSFQIVNGKIKIDTPFEYTDDDINEFTLSSGGISSVVINDDDAQENQWEKYLLVLTDGTYSGDGIIIGEHDESDGTETTLNFLHDRSTSISDSTTGYLTDQYVVLQYMAVFEPISAYDDEIPVSDQFEEALINGLSYLACPITSEQREEYRKEFEFDIERLKLEQFTPSPDQARPVPRPMAGLEDCSDFPYSKHDDFVGDTDAWLE